MRCTPGRTGAPTCGRDRSPPSSRQPPALSAAQINQNAFGRSIKSSGNGPRSDGGHRTSSRTTLHVVAYNGRDPITGRERRSWHATGASRSAVSSPVSSTLSGAERWSISAPVPGSSPANSSPKESVRSRSNLWQKCEPHLPLTLPALRQSAAGRGDRSAR